MLSQPGKDQVVGAPLYVCLWLNLKKETVKAPRPEISVSCFFVYSHKANAVRLVFTALNKYLMNRMDLKPVDELSEKTKVSISKCVLLCKKGGKLHICLFVYPAYRYIKKIGSTYSN